MRKWGIVIDRKHFIKYYDSLVSRLRKTMESEGF